MRPLQRLTGTTLTLALCLAASLPAQPAAMVKDIGTVYGDLQFQPLQKVAIAGVAYFPANDGIHGQELWRSDGTAAGTFMVKDTCPGACQGLSFYLSAWNAKLYFAGNDGASGWELFESDGTGTGTRLVKDIVPGLEDGFRRELLATPSRLYFVGWTPTHGEELWTSLGTEASTLEVADIHPTGSSQPSRLVDLAGTLLFFADDGVRGGELWRTDGSSAGTSFVHEFEAGSASPVNLGGTDLLAETYMGRSSVAWGGHAYFVAGPSLLRTDGTDLGSELFSSSPSGGFLKWLTPWSGLLYYLSNNDGLWRTDGSVAGTSLVASGQFAELRDFPGTLLMQGWDAVAGYEPWRSNGTGAGTQRILDLRPGDESSLRFAVFTPVPAGTAAFFWADDGVHGQELWITDGTEAGTVLAGDLLPGPGSSAVFSFQLAGDKPVAIGSQAVFGARAGLDQGPTLFASDGTPGSAATVKAINTQTTAASYFPFYGLQFHRGNPQGTSSGALLTTTWLSLWSSDGSTNGTIEVAPATVNGNGWYAVPHERLESARALLLNDSSLYSTSGLAGDIELLATGNPQIGWQPNTLEGKAYFSVSEDLWRTGGTAATTTLVEAGAGTPLNFVGDTLYLTRQLQPSGAELRRRLPGGPTETIGPVSGVNRVFPIGSHMILFQTAAATWTTEVNEIVGTAIQPVATLPQQPNFWIPEPTPMGSRAFFSLADSAGMELWATDGTTPGTQRVLDIAPGLRSSWPLWLTAPTTRLFFSADDGIHGRELWTSDGTAVGTQMLVDLVPGPGSSLPDQLTIFDGLLLFAATDGVNGKELWVSNGTAAGTVMLQNIAPGAASSTPHEFTVGKDRVFFLANDTVHGFELWSMTRSALALASPPAAAGFFTVTPCRIVDSRSEGGALASGTVRSLSTRGRCGIPDSARSLAVNVTTVSATSAGTLTLGSNDSQFASAALPIAAGITRATQFQLRLSPSGDGTFHLGAALVGGGSVDFIVDVVGYFE